jgi:hypothetical protein
MNEVPAPVLTLLDSKQEGGAKLITNLLQITNYYNLITHYKSLTPMHIVVKPHLLIPILK